MLVECWNRCAGRWMAAAVRLACLLCLLSLSALLWAEFCTGGIHHVLVHHERTHRPLVSLCLPQSLPVHGNMSLLALQTASTKQWRKIVADDSCVQPALPITPHLTLPHNSTAVYCFTTAEQQLLGLHHSANCSLTFSPTAALEDAFLLLHFHQLPLHAARLLAADSRQLQLVRLPTRPGPWHLHLDVDWRHQVRLSSMQRPCSWYADSKWGCEEYCSVEAAAHRVGCIPGFVAAVDAIAPDIPRCRNTAQYNAFVTAEMRAWQYECSGLCDPPCEQARFHVATQETDGSAESSNLSSIQLHVLPGPTLQLRERPAVPVEQLLANLGGLVALMLGVSVPSVADEMLRWMRLLPAVEK